MKRKLTLILILTIMILAGFSCSRAPKDISIFKSSDAGENWEQKTQLGEKKSIAGLDVLSVAVDPESSNNVFIGTIEKGIFRSQNGADVWEETSLKQGIFYTIAIDPKDSNIVYVGGKMGDLGKIFKSTDGGNEFIEVYSETHAKQKVKKIVIDHYDPKIVYAGLSTGAFLKSTDRGKSWIAANWFEGPIETIAMSAQDSRTMLVSVLGRYVYKTIDGGKTWKDLEPGLEEFTGADETYSIVFDPKDDKIVYLGSNFGLLKSTNQGKSWKKIEALIEESRYEYMSLAINPKKTKSIYLGTETNMYKTINGGKDWEVKKITNNQIRDIAIDDQAPKNIYTGVIKIQE